MFRIDHFKGGKNKLHHLKSEVDLQVLRRTLPHKTRSAAAAPDIEQLQHSGDSSSSGSTVLVPDTDSVGAMQAEVDDATGLPLPGGGCDMSDASSRPCSVSLLSLGIWEQHTAIKRRYTGATLDSVKGNTYGRHLQGLYGKLSPEELVARLREADTLFDQSDILHILYLQKYVHV